MEPLGSHRSVRLQQAAEYTAAVAGAGAVGAEPSVPQLSHCQAGFCTRPEKENINSIPWDTF